MQAAQAPIALRRPCLACGACRIDGHARSKSRCSRPRPLYALPPRPASPRQRGVRSQEPPARPFGRRRRGAHRIADRAHDAAGEGRPAQPLRPGRHQHAEQPAGRLAQRPAGDRGRAHRAPHGPLQQRRPRRQATAAAGGGARVAPRHSADLRCRRDPRLSHDLPDAAGRGFELGARAGRAHRARGGGRGHGRRLSLDLRAHGRHRARRALGPRPRGRGRRPVPGAPVRGGARARLPGQQPRERRFDAGHAQALRGLRRGRGRARLQHERNLRAHAARGLPAAVPCGDRCGRAVGHERLQRDRRRALDRQPRAAHRRAARRMEVQGLRGVRLHGRRGAHRARPRRQRPRGRQAGLHGRHRREHAKRPVHPPPARPRGVGRGADGAARRGRAARAAGQAQARPLRRPDARPRRPAGRAARGEPRVHRAGPRERAPFHRDAEERGPAAAARENRPAEDRADRPLRRRHEGPDGLLEPVPGPVRARGHRRRPACRAGHRGLAADCHARCERRVAVARRHRGRRGRRARGRCGGAGHRREPEDVGRVPLAQRHRPAAGPAGPGRSRGRHRQAGGRAAEQRPRDGAQGGRARCARDPRDVVPRRADRPRDRRRGVRRRQPLGPPARELSADCGPGALLLRPQAHRPPLARKRAGHGFQDPLPGRDERGAVPLRFRHRLCAGALRPGRAEHRSPRHRQDLARARDRHQHGDARGGRSGAAVPGPARGERDAAGA
ncbi:hypothetical protein D9M68_497710 [compost metagenome]